MIATELTLAHQRDTVTLSALVRLERFPCRTERLWWRFPAEYGDCLRLNGDPLLPALLLPAMARGERLLIEAPVSEQLLANIPKIQDLFIQWHLPVRHIEVSAPVERNRSGSGPAVGCYFSCGVDSFYSLLKNDDLPAGDKARITHLIFLNGFDIKFKRHALYQRIRSHIIGTSEMLDKRCVEASTNLKSFGAKSIAWQFYWGSVLASIGLALGPLFNTVIVASSYAWHQQHPDGSHPELDILWSTERTSFLHDGCEVTRAEKIVTRVACSEMALEHLHVCWRNRNVVYNCGVCEKCLRTMIALYARTGKTSWPNFSEPLQIENILALKDLSASAKLFAGENMDLLAGQDGFGEKVREALRTVLAASERQARRQR